MKTVIFVLLLALFAWKGFFAWKRGRSAYLRDRRQYYSLWEYLVANGATESQARRPFLKRALKRAFVPLLRQWRFWSVVSVLIVLLFVMS